MLVGHVELERVDDLVTQHMVGLRQAPGERHDDAAFAGIGEAAGTLVDEPAVDIRLLEAAMAAVEHDRLPPPKFVVEHPGQALVPALGQTSGDWGGLGVLTGVVDVEMLGREHQHVVAIVLNLVAAEILRAGIVGVQQQEQEQHG